MLLDTVKTIAETAADCTTLSNIQALEDSRLEELLALMGDGDTDGLRQFVDGFDDSLRRRIGGRLRSRGRLNGIGGPDQDELYAEVLRRLFSIVRTRRLRARKACEFWALVGTIIDHAAIDQTRSRTRSQSLTRASAENQRMTQMGLEAPSSASNEPSLELNEVYEALTCDEDRVLLRMWIHGMPWTIAAEHLGVTPACVRKRWEQVRRTLRSRLVPQEG